MSVLQKISDWMTPKMPLLIIAVLAIGLLFPDTMGKLCPYITVLMCAQTFFSSLGGSFHLVVGGIRIAETDVFKQRAAEQEVILRDKADIFRKLLKRHILDIHAADGNLAGGDIPKPCN